MKKETFWLFILLMVAYLLGFKFSEAVGFMTWDFIVLSFLVIVYVLVEKKYKKEVILNGGVK